MLDGESLRLRRGIVPDRNTAFGEAGATTLPNGMDCGPLFLITAPKTRWRTGFPSSTRFQDD